MPSDLARRIGYRMVQPPGWTRIPLDDTSDGVIAELVDQAASVASPGNRAPIRAFLKKQFTELVVDGKRRGGQDFYLPIETVEGIPTPMSIMVAAGPAPVSDTTSAVSEALLAFSAQHSGAQATSIDGQLAVRTAEDVDAQVDAAGNVTLPASRRIDYLSATPGSGARMLVVAANLVRVDAEEGERLVEAMEFLFDTMVGTIRFDAGEVSHE